MSPHVTHEHHEANGAGAHPEFAVSNGNHAEPVTNGTAAVNGAAYANGVTAATPVNGANGINGTNGTPSVNGTNGTTSNSGTNGTNGTSSGSYTNEVNGDIDNTNGHLSQSPYLRASDPDAVHDLICVGFGPASLAVAVALHDALEAGTISHAPKVLFLEKQARFAWHAGMLLPGAKMQISFIKDLASLRDPRSNFTFVNYLHKNGRLVEFTNLGTFLPARVEYEDYLRWCAGHFDDVVKYQTEVLSVSPVPDQAGPLDTFNVTSRNVKSGATTTYRGKNVLLAIGGQPSIPKSLPAGHPRVIHSSQYAHLIPKILTDHSRPYRVAVVGAGQSAAEIFHNIQTLYPKSSTWLVMRSEFLKPSDDSPFVNSIFNPAFIDSLYPRSTAYRRSLISEARATNYGVVRLELIEHLYEVMYEQRRQLGSDESKWPHRIMGGRRVLGVEEVGDALRVKVCLSPPGELELDGPAREEEVLDADLIISATGYGRSAHVDMLKDAWPLLPEVVDKSDEAKAFAARDRWHVETPGGSEGEASRTRSIEVGRDYGVRFSAGAVASGSGVWLQGCCEGTHGLSDTLLSVLATRSGEIVDSIFRKGAKGATNGGASY